MRRPTLNLAAVERGLEKLRHWSHKNETASSQPENLTVVNPRMWPWFSRPHDRRLNRWLLRRSLQGVVDAGQPNIAITTIPIVADLIGVLPVDRWVYYCVDDFTVWPGLDQTPLREMEDKLVRECDRIIAVSETLQARLASMGRDSQLLTHGVDLDFWQTGGGPAPQLLSRFEKPWVVFWGVIDQRMDPGFVGRLAEDLRRGTIFLIGPEQDPDPALTAPARVVQCPAVALDQLPAIGAAADVLIMPYRDIPVTRAIQPLKLKEYLAVGKPVVVRDLPAVRAWADCLDAAASPEEFSRLVRSRLENGLDEDQRRARTRLAAESWSAKAKQFEQWAIL
jgi:glycosyltransferase involved in cell wall biosynthesis